MTQEEKRLLLKDLCARFLYGVICTDLRHGDSKITEVNVKDNLVYCFDFDEYVRIENCRLYLRLMSSMTEEERKELEGIFNEYDNPCTVDEDGCLSFYGGNDFLSPEDLEIYIDFCNQHHLDYRGLIEKDLAIEAPEGMYKTE